MSYEQYNNFTNPVTSQPVGNSQAPGATPINGVTIRPLQDTPTDAEFAGRLLVEAFRGKFAHNVTEHKLPATARYMAANNRGQTPAFYQRTLVAELEGMPVGLMQLKFHGDKYLNTADDDMLTSELGCWRTFRFACFSLITDEDVKKGKCYVDHICVDDRARGRGVGKLLLDRADYEARQRQCHTIYLGVLTTNRAMRLYERQGYHVTSTSSMCGCLYCCIGPPGKIYHMEKPLSTNVP
ncbi:uncharacterized protein [Amphiura filiformis]|uniref:uncharacterized protein n=1 Tax=Amphiura filiformis TaxID=82378 RepID=UPI003B218DBD